MLKNLKQKMSNYVNGPDDFSESTEAKHKHTVAGINFFLVFIITVVGFLSATSLFTFVINQWHRTDHSILIINFFIPIILGLIFYFLYFLIFNRLTRKQSFKLSLCIVIILVELMLFTKYEPFNDAGTIYQTLMMLRKGDLSLLNSEYYYVFTNQISYLMLFDVLNLLPAIYYPLNCIFYIIGFFIIGKISDEINPLATKHAWIIYAFYLPFALYMGDYYRNLIGTVWILIFTYQVIRIGKNQGQFINYILALIASCFGYLWNNWMMIPIIASLIIFILYKSTTKKEWFKKLLIPLLSFLFIFSVPIISKQYFKIRYDFDTPKQYNSELSWIVMGNLPLEFNEQYRLSIEPHFDLTKDETYFVNYSEGHYNSYPFYYYRVKDIKDMDEILRHTKQDAIDLINYWRIRPLEYADFLFNKTVKQWHDVTMDGWVNGAPLTIENGMAYYNYPIVQFFLYFNEYSFTSFTLLFKGFWVVGYGLLFIYILRKRNKLSLPEMLILITLVGAFTFSCIHEAKSRYIMPFAILLFPVIANAFHIYGFVPKVKNKRAN